MCKRTLTGHKKQLQLLIKWKGYPEADNTWEPVEGVFAPQLVKEFYEYNPTAIKTAEPPPLLLRTTALQKPTRNNEDDVSSISPDPLLQQRPQRPVAMSRILTPV